MKRRKLVIGLLVGVLVLGVAGVATAAPWGRGLWCGPGRGDVSTAVKAVQDLGLTDEQLQKIRQIQADAFSQLKDLRQAQFEKMFELQQLLWQKNPDEEAIAAKQAEVKELRDKMAEIQRSVRDQMKQVLTEEQLGKLQQGWGPGHRGRGPRGGFRGQPPSGNGPGDGGGSPF